MTSREVPARIAQHAAAFNAAVQSGDWRSFADRFTQDATMRFIGVPAGPFVGRAAIAQAYAEQPPTDRLTIRDVDSTGAVDTAFFAWSAGGGGAMRLTWEGPLVASLDVTFDN
jgi:ketosteroid isomerase-like protein